MTIHRHLPFGLLLLGAVFGASLAHAQGQDQEQPPMSVSTAEARRLAVAPTIDVPGTVISRTDAEVAAEIGGRVETVLDVGDTVAQGAPIAELDKRLLRLQVEEDEATVRRLESNLAFLGREVERFEELARRNATPARSVDEAIVQRDLAGQDLAVARIALERARVNLERATVKAPFDGQVVERRVEPGEFVSAGTPVARLVDTASVEVRARVPVRTAPYLRAGMSLDLTGFDQEAEGTIRTLVRVGSDVTRTFEIRIAIPEGLWVIGTPVRVAVPTSEPREVVAVPRDALVLRQSGTSVFKVTAENTASRVRVETGAGAGSLIEVQGAIEAGDQVVIRGAERLRDGQRVTVVGAT